MQSLKNFPLSPAGADLNLLADPLAKELQDQEAERLKRAKGNNAALSGSAVMDLLGAVGG